MQTTFLELICEFGKVAGYKINPQKLTIFLYLGNEHMETEIEDRITFKIAQKKKKYLEVNIKKCAHTLNNENYKILIKEIKEDQINRETCHIHGLEDSTR